MINTSSSGYQSFELIEIEDGKKRGLLKSKMMTICIALRVRMSYLYPNKKYIIVFKDQELATLTGKDLKTYTTQYLDKTTQSLIALSCNSFISHLLADYIGNSCYTKEIGSIEQKPVSRLSIKPNSAHTPSIVLRGN